VDAVESNDLSRGEVIQVNSSDVDPVVLWCASPGRTLPLSL